jgi:hypothetical protein
MGRWSDYQAERAQRKAGETETGKELIGQRELVWAKLTEAQKGFWESRYQTRVMGMRHRSAKFRELGQSIRSLSVLLGATVAALSGFAGVPMRIIVAVLGVILAVVNAAPSIFSTERRVIINRRFSGLLLNQGWIFVLAVRGSDDTARPHSATVGDVDFETFRSAVEKLLLDFDVEYEKNVYEAGKS